MSRRGAGARVGGRRPPRPSSRRPSTISTACSPAPARPERAAGRVKPGGEPVARRRLADFVAHRLRGTAEGGRIPPRPARPTRAGSARISTSDTSRSRRSRRRCWPRRATGAPRCSTRTRSAGARASTVATRMSTRSWTRRSPGATLDFTGTGRARRTPRAWSARSRRGPGDARRARGRRPAVRLFAGRMGGGRHPRPAVERGAAASWSPPGRFTPTCGCCGERRCWSGRARPGKPTRRSST